MLNWLDLVRLSETHLAAFDVAMVNLACADALPGTDSLDIAQCVQTLDEWAEFVRDYTEQRFSRFHRRPQEYNNSEAYFRCLCLVTILWRDCGVHYNEAKLPEGVPLNPEDTFIHGVIQGQGGTCASLPVVYAAVGRRLGYPLKLVSARAGEHGHLFVRWDGEGDRLNLDVNETGLSCPTDEEFRTGLFQIIPELERVGYYLRSQTTRQELAGFLVQRGHLCWELGWYREATNAFAWALALHPECELLHNNIVRICNEWGNALRAEQPPGFPQMDVVWPPRRFPPPFPEEYERAILGLEAWEELLRSPEYKCHWWEPLQRGESVPTGPTKVRIAHTGSGCDLKVKLG